MSDIRPSPQPAIGQKPAIELKHVDIVFAGDGHSRRKALDMIDAGESREAILKASGAVLGAAGVNLTVEKGEICVLMGLSGSGKSTVLRAINGLNTTTRGQILVSHEGETVDVASCSPRALRDLRQKRVAMVFQQFALLPWRTVGDNVGFGLELAGMPVAERKSQVAQKLAMVGLTQWSEKFAHELSGGMQQRVGLARAFATDPDVLLMDEPFSALDPLIRAKLQDELLILQRQVKKTIVFVSHDLDEALKLGTHIAIMEGGRVVQFGRPEDIVLHPADDYVREFVANVNPMNILTAYHVMRDMRDLAVEDGWVTLQTRPARVRLQLDGAHKVITAEVDGQPADWLASREANRPFPEHQPIVFWANVNAPLRHIIRAMQRDAGPVAVFDDEHRLLGVIGVRDVLTAVLHRED
ncbi:MAG: choline ABC transporter ATP-binding protein [Ancalomicrobiaceae bacterium]|nr:choline ABC transporter ATP-binding protein [Ancalomicrobiaceae bacterium]